MASNPTPDNNDILRALADRIADGCHTHEVSLGIKQNTEAVIRAAILGLETAEAQVGTKKMPVSSAYDAVQAADDAGKTVLTNCKLRLAQKLGQRWSAAWEPTGFPGQSTAVPSSQDARFTLLNDLKTYFTNNPANESTDMGATAALCLAAWTALSDARAAVGNAESAQTTAFTERASAADTLRRRVRGLIGELETLMQDDDPRYEAFGLNIPANPTAPEPVELVTLTALGNGRIGVAWPYAVRATRVGLEPGREAAGSPAAQDRSSEVCAYHSSRRRLRFARPDNMRDLDVGVLPVCQGGPPAGMITDRDLSLRAVAESRKRRRPSK